MEEEFLQPEQGIHVYNHLLSNQNTLRGYILGMTIQIERKIDDYISSYFCGSLKKKNQINELIFFTERITLDMKRQVFVSLLKSNKSTFIESDPKFLKTLEDIVPHRNIFAHLQPFPIHDLPQEDRKKLVFKKYSNGVLKPKKYDQELIYNLQTDLMYVDFCLDILLQELPL